MASRIHELQALITANIARFNSGLDQAQKKTEQFRQSWGRAAADVGSAATKLTLAITGVGTAAATAFAQYESVMIRAQAVTRTSGTAMGESLNKLARQMGETTVFSATQAAQAIEQMGLAGLTVTEIHESLGGALQLAAAAQVDIATAADIAAKTMRAFGADASELSHINDVLVGTFTRANTDIRQLGEAMKPVAPISKALGVSIEDTAAAIAKMSDAGFQGSMAGTALRNILSRLAGAAPEVTNQLNALGIQTLDASGNMLPFLDILEQIERQGITDAQVLQLFGARGGPQMLALLEVGSQGLREFSSELRGLQGITQEISDRNLESLSSQFALVVSKATELALSVGERLKPGLVGLFQSVTGFMEQNKEAAVALASEGFNTLVRFMSEVIVSAREIVPNLLNVSRAVWDLLTPLLKFLSEHPRLVQMLVLLKGAQMFGVIQAVTSLGAAFMSTGRLVAGFAATLASELIPVITSLGTTVFVRAQMALSSFASALVNRVIPAIGAAVLHAGSLISKLSWFQLGLAGGGIGLAIAGIAAFANALINLREAQLRAAQQQEEFNATVARGLELMDKNFQRDLEGGNLRQMKTNLVQRREQALANQRAQMGAATDAERRIRQRGIGERAGQFLRDAVTGLPGMNVESDPLRGEANANREMAAATQKQIEMLDRQIAELDRRIANQGRGRVQQWDPNAAGNQARGGVMRRGRGGAPVEIGAMPVGDAAASVSDTGIDKMIAEQNAAFAAEQQAQQTERAAQMAREFGETLLQLQNSGQLAAQQVDYFAHAAVDLRDDLIGGHITVDEFSRSMQNLQAATTAATEAARQEEEQKRRQALLRGDFSGAGLDFRQALQDRIAQFRMQQFNGAVENAFNNMFGLNQAMQPVTQGFTTLHDRLQGVNQNMRAAAGGGGGGGGGRAPGVGQAFGTLAGFLSSPGGQVANLRNQIQLLQQNLGLVDTYRQRRRILNQISQLESQIAAISRPRPPVFAGISGDVGFRDPGIQQSVNQLNLSFPNLTRMSNSEVSQMADRLQAELERRGRRL